MESEKDVSQETRSPLIHLGAMFVSDQSRRCSLTYYLSGRDFVKCPVCKLNENIRTTVRTYALKVTSEHKFKATLSPFIIAVALEERMLFAISAM